MEREVEECLREAIDLIDAIREGNYVPDSFTTQPWINALKDRRPSGGDWEKELDEKFLNNDVSDMKGDNGWRITQNHASYIWAIKSFIRTLLARQSGVEITEEEWAEVLFNADILYVNGKPRTPKWKEAPEGMDKANARMLAQAVMRKMRGDV